MTSSESKTADAPSSTKRRMGPSKTAPGSVRSGKKASADSAKRADEQRSDVEALVGHKRKGEKRADEQPAELADLYQTAPVGLCFLDCDLRFVRINARLAAINGKPVEEHIGQTLQEVIPEVAKTQERIYQRVIETGEPELDFEVNARTTAWRGTALVSYYPVKSEDGTVLGVNTVSIGSVSASIVHPRETFRIAILMGASSIILAHCHPSGDPSPSQDDIDLTKRLAKGGEILGIEVLDHIIIADHQFLSLKEEGLL